MTNLDTEWFNDYTVIGQIGLSVVCENNKNEQAVLRCAKW
jgi:hypothetical protein